MTQAQKIYFDESGFTGADLLNEEQPLFAYSAIAINTKEADKIINNLRTKFRINSNELKLKTLKKRSNCKNIFQYFLEEVKDKSVAICLNKKFGLCAKFFDYIFEPTIETEYKTLYYESGFNRFIAYTLYNEYFKNNTENHSIMKEFYTIMRSDNKKLLMENLINQLAQKYSTITKYKSFNDKICLFIIKNKEKILSEMEDINDDKNINDISFTSLFSLCAEMTERYGEIQIIYDESKMLNTQISEIEKYMKQSFEIPNYNFLIKKESFKFNFSGKMTSADSILQPEIQIADLLAGIVNYTMINNDNDLLKILLKNRILINVVSAEVLQNGIVDILKIPYKQIFNQMIKNIIRNKELTNLYIINKLYALKEAGKSS